MMNTDLKDREGQNPANRSLLNPTPDDRKLARGAIVSLLRGAFSCPVIATLAELGITDRMLSGPFHTSDFANVTNLDALNAIFGYLRSLELIVEMGEGSYQLTPQGRTVFKRSGSFLLLYSYRDYFNQLGKSLRGEADEATVDRLHNVLGSGSLHSQKFFPSAWKLIGNSRPDALIDIGCGDGRFLELACANFPGCEFGAIDLSPIAVETTLERLDSAAHATVTGIVASGEDIDAWSAQLPETMRKGQRQVISMWFVAHEFSKGDPGRVVKFFKKLHSVLPSAEILLGEITAISPEVLAANRASSIMPEYLLFHRLSHQGVLAWGDWLEILDSIPYALSAEERFDLVDCGTEQPLPSSFVWHLKPAN